MFWQCALLHRFRDIEKELTDALVKHCCCHADALKDDFRVKYYQDYLPQAIAAVEQDGVKLKGYFAWSLLDNFGKNRSPAMDGI